MADVRISKSAGLAFLVAFGVMLEAVAAWCSSPQTTELNADKRSDTLMKWVGLGLLGGAIGVGIAAWIDPPLRRPILAGGFVAGTLLGVSYLHARSAGLSNGGPETESY